MHQLRGPACMHIASMRMLCSALTPDKHKQHRTTRTLYSRKVLEMARTALLLCLACVALGLAVAEEAELKIETLVGLGFPEAVPVIEGLRGSPPSRLCSARRLFSVVQRPAIAAKTIDAVCVPGLRSTSLRPASARPRTSTSCPCITRAC